jgi:hypothetical protein
MMSIKRNESQLATFKELYGKTCFVSWEQDDWAAERLMEQLDLEQQVFGEEGIPIYVRKDRDTQPSTIEEDFNE